MSCKPKKTNHSHSDNGTGDYMQSQAGLLPRFRKNPLDYSYLLLCVLVYILPQIPHNKVMEKNTTTKTKAKHRNPMQKLGTSIKNTFIEMSSSLAGWIDDTGMQLSGQKPPQKTSVSGAKFVTQQQKKD